MTNPVAAKSDPTFIQRNLIPEKSRYVRFVMQKAADFGSSSNLFYAHVVSVGFAVAAVVMSAFNAISYLLQTPVKILLNIVQFNPLKLVANFVVNLGDVAKSLLFVSLGVTLVVAGFLFPAPIFKHFSPEYYKPKEQRLEEQLDEAKAEVAELKAERALYSERNNNIDVIIKDNSTEIEGLAKQIEDLKKSKKWFWQK